MCVPSSLRGGPRVQSKDLRESRTQRPHNSGALSPSLGSTCYSREPRKRGSGPCSEDKGFGPKDASKGPTVCYLCRSQGASFKLVVRFFIWSLCQELSLFIPSWLDNRGRLRQISTRRRMFQRKTFFQARRLVYAPFEHGSQAAEDAQVPRQGRRVSWHSIHSQK